MAALVEVLDFSAPDLAQVAELALSARAEAGLGAQLCIDEAERIEHHLRAFSQLDGTSILLAWNEDRVIGFALIRCLKANLFLDFPSVYIEAIFVSDEYRRRGAGHALLSAVCERAEAIGATDIYAIPLPGARGVQRFLARLGFAPAGAHRVVSAVTLQRNLSSEHNSTKRISRSLEDLIARRRKSRTELHSGPVDLRAFQAAHALAQTEADPAHEPQRPAESVNP